MHKNPSSMPLPSFGADASSSRAQWSHGEENGEMHFLRASSGLEMDALDLEKGEFDALIPIRASESTDAYLTAPELRAHVMHCTNYFWEMCVAPAYSIVWVTYSYSLFIQHFKDEVICAQFAESNCVAIDLQMSFPMTLYGFVGLVFFFCVGNAYNWLIDLDQHCERCRSQLSHNNVK